MFLFDKVMLICRKVSKLVGSEVRYNPKQVFPVSMIRVEPITNPSGRGGRFTHGFKLIVKGQGDFLAFAKTEELKSQWIDAINHARYVRVYVLVIVQLLNYLHSIPVERCVHQGKEEKVSISLSPPPPPPTHTHMLHCL